MASFFGFARGQTKARTGSRQAPPGARGERDLPGARSARDLNALVSSEVIPRMVAFAQPPLPAPDIAARNPFISDADIDALVPLALSVEADALIARIEALLARGVPVEALLVDLLAPVARRLGSYWDDDRCDFVEVTMGVWRLQEVVHELAARVAADRPASSSARRVLIAAMPGDQHGFGAVLIAQLFEGRGWLTDRLGEASAADLRHCLAGDWYDLVALTVSSDSHKGPLPGLIHALRSVSKNPRLKIMVGGPAFAGDPDQAAEVGADGTAGDARAAVELAAALVAAADAAADLRD